MASIFLVLGLVVFGGPAVHQTNNPILLVSANGSLAKIGSVVFALGCAPATFHAYVGLQGSTPKKWNNVITHAVTIGALMCCVMGICKRSLLITLFTLFTLICPYLRLFTLIHTYFPPYLHVFTPNFHTCRDRSRTYLSYSLGLMAYCVP